MRNNCENKNGNFDIYSAYVDNLNYIEYSLSDTFKQLKLKIKENKDNDKEFHSNTKLLILLIGIWSEARLMKLISERNIFNKREIQLIESEKIKTNQWKLVIELSFRKHYKIYFGDELTKDNLKPDIYQKYVNIIEYVEIYITSIIEVRNKLAHGQWVCQPNNKKNALINNINVQQLSQENFLSLEKKYQILKFISNLIHDLVVSPKTFERDFIKNYLQIEERINFLKKHIDTKYPIEVNKLKVKKHFQNKKRFNFKIFKYTFDIKIN